MPIEDPGCVTGVCSGADCCECQTSKIFEHPHRDQDKRCKLTSSRQPSEPPWRRGTQESLCNATIFVLIDCHPCWCYTSRSHPLQCTTQPISQRLHCCAASCEKLSCADARIFWESCNTSAVIASAAGRLVGSGSAEPCVNTLVSAFTHSFMDFTAKLRVFHQKTDKE